MNSQLILCKGINVDREYKNVLSLNNSNMLAVCRQHQVATSTNFSFIRQNTGVINTDFTYSQCLTSNYIAFQNPEFDNKWFFAWIDDIIYKANNTTQIQYTIDAWSTWFGYWNPSRCWVIREHVNDDTVGLHTIPEDLNTGSYISDWVTTLNDLGSESFYWFVIASNYDPSNNLRYSGVSTYGGYPQGSVWFAWLINNTNPAPDIESISDWVFNITKNGHAGDIQTMFALPYQAISISQVDTTTHLLNAANKLNTNIEYVRSTLRSFEDYTPINNKLYVYPYSFLRVTNNMGSYNDYKFEDFTNSDDKVEFNLIGVPCQGYSGKLRPVNYQGITYNEDESLPLGKYPTLSWSSDGFTNWLTQNAINIGIDAVKTAISFGTTSMNSISSATLSTSGQIAGTIGNMVQASMIPNTAQGNANSGDVAFSQNINRFKLIHMRPKLEYLKIIDNYFSRFGYTVNELKNANITGRQSWNYVEIGNGEEIGTGTVPTKYMNIINNACQSGVTIWHDHSFIGNYNLDNSILE